MFLQIKTIHLFLTTYYNRQGYFTKVFFVETYDDSAKAKSAFKNEHPFSEITIRTKCLALKRQGRCDGSFLLSVGLVHHVSGENSST